LPVIILTAGLCEEYKLKAKEVGAHEILAKNYQGERLLDLLRDTCRNDADQPVH
jgi:hypothetical protein